jgi:hemoglobin
MIIKNTLIPALAFTLSITAAIGQDAPSPEPQAAVCFYTGDPAKPGVTLDYEGTTYAFSSEEKRAQFEKERAASLYQQIGGAAALTAAVDLFYVKVLADERVNHFFEDINMKTQNRKQKAFLAAVLGAPVPWTGKDMRAAHANLDIREEDFNAIAENLQNTLTELKLDEKLITQIMTIVASTKDDVLNR